MAQTDGVGVLGFIGLRDESITPAEWRAEREAAKEGRAKEDKGTAEETERARKNSEGLKTLERGKKH